MNVSRMAGPDRNSKNNADPSISVVVVAYQSGPHLTRCLAHLSAQTFTDFEILVVDNASTDGAPQIAARADPDLILIEPGANLGFAAGNNLAAARARGRWLALLNPDAFPEPDWLEALVAATRRHPAVQCFASLQLVADEPHMVDGAGDVMTTAGVPYRGGYRRKLRGPLREGSIFSACGAATLIDRALYLRLGGFDERFFCYCEDVDLGYRLRLDGGDVLMVPDARVAHVGSASTGVRSAFAIFHGSRNRIWTYLKNTPPLLLWPTIPLHVVVTMGLLVLHLRRGAGMPMLRGIRAALARDDLSSILASRRQIQAERKVGAWEILRIMAFDPVAFFGRRIVIRRLKGPRSAGA
jgi:GT2 family glycosyltransferase